MSTIGVGGREELRGLGEELVRLDFRAHGDGPFKRRYSRIVADADRELHDALHPYDDLALLESHGEQLLDFVIRLACKWEWNTWRDNSMKIAASTGAADVLLRLIASCEDSVNAETLATLLNAAAEGGSVETLSALIAAGAGPLVRAVDDENGRYSALHVAARRGHRSFVARLIEAGAPVDVRHTLGGTALTEAVGGGHKGLALDLLAAGADVNKTRGPKFHQRGGDPMSCRDLTPLCIAVATNDKRMVKVLLEAGADPAKGPTDHLPLHMAARQGSRVIIYRLLLAGARVSSVDNEGRSALHHACAHNRRQAVALLLRHNASVALLCNRGLSPMDVVGLQVLALQQRDPIRRHWTPSGVVSDPSTLNTAQTSAVDKICGMLQSASAWDRRGWLVMMRSRAFAEVAEQPGDSDAENSTLSVRDICLVHEPSSNTAGVREEGGTARALHGSGHAGADWSAAVVWLLQRPDETLFWNIVRFL